MSDSRKNVKSESKLKLKAPRRIVLRKTVEGGSIKQNFSHGRSKSVVVEVRRKKTFVNAADQGTPVPQSTQDETAVAVSESPPPSGPPSVESVAAPPVVSGGRPKRSAVSSKQPFLRPLTPEQHAALREEEASQPPPVPPQAVEPEIPTPPVDAPVPSRATEIPASDSSPAAVATQEAPSAPEDVPVAPPILATTDGQSVPQEATVAPIPVEPPPESPGAITPPAPPVSSPEAPAQSVPASATGAKEVPATGIEPSVPVDAPVASAGPKAVRSRAAAPVTIPSATGPQTKKAPAPRKPAAAQALKSATSPADTVNVPVIHEIQRAEEAFILRRDIDLDDEDDVDSVRGAKGIKRSRKKLTRAQREEVARQKAEDLVTKRLSQLEELREQKRAEEKRRTAAALEVVAKEDEVATPSRSRRRRKRGGAATENAPAQPGTPTAAPTGRLSMRGGRGRGRRGPPPPVVPFQPPAPVIRDVIIPEAITVGELASRMAVKSSEVIKLLFNQGMMVTINQSLDQDTAVLVVGELGHRAKPVSESANIALELAESTDTDDVLESRPPVVTIMGHVDHGKTSLLDAIRKTDVTSREFGGITQHIGAYQVTLSTGARLTFLDTPGHAAFTAMRARGAQATDIVVLVVAADDGVMPQTIEAINHAKAAKVPILVAVNKIDRESANPDRVMQQLMEYELVAEKWGGETLFCNVSAHTGDGIAELEEAIQLQAEMLNLTANPNKTARGVIVEAKLDKGRGSVATCLVQNGTLRVGDILVAGAEWGKIRTLLNDRGRSVQEAPPAMPVEIIGLSGVPSAGDDMVVVPDEKRARDIALFRTIKLKEQALARQAANANLGDLFHQIQQGEIQELKVVLKADVQGSVEAVADALTKITHDQVKVTVIHTGVGGINESDVMLALASRAIILGFNVRADAKGRELAKREQLDMQFYNIIYDLVDDITRAMEGLLQPTFEETLLGHAEVRQVFRISKVGNVAGCLVTDGVVRRDALIRVLRDSVVVHEGALSALKHYKDDAKEVRAGIECGMSLDRFTDIKAGDVLEAYSKREVRQTIGK